MRRGGRRADLDRPAPAVPELLAGEERRMSDKKPYRPPRLTVYGDLREITKATATSGNVMDMVSGNPMLKSA
jgi:hypothetical protein